MAGSNASVEPRIEHIDLAAQQAPLRPAIEAAITLSLGGSAGTGGRHSAPAQHALRTPPARRDAIQTTRKALGVPTAVYYPRPLHHQGANHHYPFVGSLPMTEPLSAAVPSLPMHPYLSADQQDYIIDCVPEALQDGDQAA